MSNTLSQVARRSGVSLTFANALHTRDSKSALREAQQQLGPDDVTLVCLGWPVERVLEAKDTDKAPEKTPEKASYTFDLDKVEGDDRSKLLRALQEEKFKIIWELLKGQVICIPDLAEDDHGKLEGVLKKYKLKAAPVKEAVEPLLVALFLLEFYNVEKTGASSRVVAEDGSVTTSHALVEEILLLESTVSYKTWLTAMFPGCPMEYVEFLAAQAPKA